MTDKEWDTLRETLYSYGYSPQRVLEAEEHVRSLTPKRQRILLLALRGMNHHEIARKTDTPRRTISDNISHVIAQTDFSPV